ncbi:hypothetical protein V8017_07395 [Stenotrophomonas rhizophila]
MARRLPEPLATFEMLGNDMHGGSRPSTCTAAHAAINASAASRPSHGASITPGWAMAA